MYICTTTKSVSAFFYIFLYICVFLHFLHFSIGLPRKADVVVSEVLDSELIGEGLLNVLRDANARLLREVHSKIMVP